MPSLTQIQPVAEAPSLFSNIRKWAEFVKFSHTVFALPFALASMAVAARDQRGWPGWRIFLLDPGGDGLRAHLRHGLQPHRRPGIRPRQSPHGGTPFAAPEKSRWRGHGRFVW